MTLKKLQKCLPILIIFFVLVALYSMYTKEQYLTDEEKKRLRAV